MSTQQRPVVTNRTSLPTAAFPTLHLHPVLPLLSLPSRSFAAKTMQRFFNRLKGTKGQWQRSDTVFAWFTFKFDKPVTRHSCALQVS